MKISEKEEKYVFQIFEPSQNPKKCNLWKIFTYNNYIKIKKIRTAFSTANTFKDLFLIIYETFCTSKVLLIMIWINSQKLTFQDMLYLILFDLCTQIYMYVCLYVYKLILPYLLSYRYYSGTPWPPLTKFESY